MDIKVTIKIESLELLIGAISALATAQISGATTAVINKAAGTKKPAAKTEVASTEAAPAAAEVAEDPKPSSPAADAQVNEAAQTTDPATEAKPAATAESQTSTAAASPSSISDEELRAAATTAARKDKTKVQALVNKYAANVSAIAAADRPAFLKELETV